MMFGCVRQAFFRNLWPCFDGKNHNTLNTPLKFKVPYFQTILEMVIQGDFKLILFGDLLNLVISWFKYHRSKTHIFFHSPLVSSYCSST